MSCVAYNKSGRIQSANNHLFTNISLFLHILISGQLCKMPKSFNCQPCTFEGHLLMHLCCKQKSQIHRGSIFTFSDSLPAVKSNTDFGKLTLMALEKYSLEIEENLVSVSACCDEQ